MKRQGILRSLVATTALIVLLAVSADAGEGEHDAVYPVKEGTRLVVDHPRGSLVIVAWDRDEIQVEADYDGDSFDLEVRDRGLRFEVALELQRGVKGYGGGDLELRVPKWMPVEVNGHEVDVEIEGTEADIDVDLVGGDVFVVGGRDEVEIRTVHGGIEIHDAIAELELSSTHEDVELRDCVGGIRVESVNGDIRMEGVATESMEIETTNGDVLFDGDLDPAGDFFVSTHQGDIAIGIPSDANMTVRIETYHGDIQCGVDAEVEEEKPGKRYRIVLGEGRGRMELETFKGEVILYDPKAGRRKRG